MGSWVSRGLQLCETLPGGGCRQREDGVPGALGWRPRIPRLPPVLVDRLLPILLLLGSNVFMTFAWYGHLKFKQSPLFPVILASWGIAFFEYMLQVPANRLGSAVYSAPQLKGMQEVITLLVFAGFSAWYLGQPLRWNHWAGFGLIIVAAWLIFLE